MKCNPLATQVIALALSLLGVAAAHAACSRPIIVPAAATGNSVKIDGNVVSGVYPDVLRELGTKHGCEFRFPVVPRARADLMVLDSNAGDILIPASRTSERDEKARFVSLINVVPAVVSMRPNVVSPKSLQDLKTGEFRAVAVRRFNYGDDYQALLNDLQKRNKIEYVAEISNIVRMLAKERADYTIMAPTLFHTTLLDMDDVKEQRDLFQYHTLKGLLATDSGAYLSARSLSEADRAAIERIFADAKTGGPESPLWRAFLRYYPKNVLEGAVFLK